MFLLFAWHLIFLFLFSLAEAERRSAEMDADPSLELSYEEFMAGLHFHAPSRMRLS
jgi:hypothetical protein